MTIFKIFSSVHIRRLRPLVLFIITILPASQVSAQWKLGVHAGYTNNKLTVDSGFAYDRRYSSRGGFTIGIPAQYGFFDWLAVQADLSYIEKGYNMQRTGYYARLHNNTDNSYLQLPVYARFSFGGSRLRGFLNLGGYAGYWLSSHTTGSDRSSFDNSIYHFNEKVPFDPRRDNRFEAGMLAGIGLQYQLTARIQLTLEGRYCYSLTDMQRQYMINQSPRYNNTISVQAGCMFTLGDLHKQ